MSEKHTTILFKYVHMTPYVIFYHIYCTFIYLLNILSRISLSPSKAIGVIGSPPGVVGLSVGESGGGRSGVARGIGIKSCCCGGDL